MKKIGILSLLLLLTVSVSTVMATSKPAKPIPIEQVVFNDEVVTPAIGSVTATFAPVFSMEIGYDVTVTASLRIDPDSGTGEGNVYKNVKYFSTSTDPSPQRTSGTVSCNVAKAETVSTSGSSYKRSRTDKRQRLCSGAGNSERVWNGSGGNSWRSC